MSTTQEIIARLNNGDGAEVGTIECPAHGTSHALVIVNQGGHDCTEACLACAAELNQALAGLPPGTGEPIVDGRRI